MLLGEGSFRCFRGSGAVFDGATRLAWETSSLSATTNNGRQKSEAEERLPRFGQWKGQCAIVRMTKVMSSWTDVVQKFI